MLSLPDNVQRLIEVQASLGTALLESSNDLSLLQADPLFVPQSQSGDPGVVPEPPIVVMPAVLDALKH